MVLIAMAFADFDFPGIRRLRSPRRSRKLPIPQLLMSVESMEANIHTDAETGEGPAPPAVADSSGAALPGSGQCEAATSSPSSAREPMPLLLARSELEAQPGCSAPDARTQQMSSNAEMDELRTLPAFQQLSLVQQSIVQRISSKLNCQTDSIVVTNPLQSDG